MALQKEIIFKGGCTASYWLIGQISWVKSENRTYVDLYGYFNQTTRQETFENKISELNKGFAFEGNLSIAQCYEKIKESKIVEGVETNFFADAVDV